MAATFLPPRALPRLFAARGRPTPRPIARPPRPLFARSSSSGGGGAASQSSQSSPARSTAAAGLGLLASLACPALFHSTTAALCDDDGDDDLVARIKSKMASASLDAAGALGGSVALDAAAAALGRRVSDAVASGVPTDVSYGFFAGYFSGLALKKVGRLASVTLGAGFLALQTLAYYGYIDVHHEKLQKQVEGILDRNNDGVVDADDLKAVLLDAKRVAGFGLENDEGNNKKLIASGGGFGMGFWGGLRSG